MSFPDISLEEEKLFSQLATRIKLRSEIEKISIEIEKNLVKEEIEGLDLSNERKELEERKSVLKEEYDEISEEELPYLILKKDLSDTSIRLQKLEERKDSISQKVFDSLYSEYLEKHQNLQSKIANEERRIREILDRCRDFLEKLTENREEIMIRSELGEIDKQELNSKLDELNKQKLRAEDLVAVTSQILE